MRARDSLTFVVIKENVVFVIDAQLGGVGTGLETAHDINARYFGENGKPQLGSEDLKNSWHIAKTMLVLCHPKLKRCVK